MPTVITVKRGARKTLHSETLPLISLQCLSETQTPVLHPWPAGSVPGDETKAPLQSPCWAAPYKPESRCSGTAPHSTTSLTTWLTMASRSTKDHTQPFLTAASQVSLSLSHLILQRPGETGPMVTVRGNKSPQRPCWESNLSLPNFKAQETLKEFPKNLLYPLLFLFTVVY